MRARHDFLLVLRVCMSEEVSTDKATWQPSMAATIPIHQCRGLCLKFVHIIDQRIACVMYWLSGLYGLFHCVASVAYPLMFSPRAASQGIPPPHGLVSSLVGGPLCPGRGRVSCGGVPGIQPDRAAKLSLWRCASVTAVRQGSWSAAKPVRMGWLYAGDEVHLVRSDRTVLLVSSVGGSPSRVPIVVVHTVQAV